MAPLSLSGLRIRTYIDDWLIITKSKEKVLLVTGPGARAHHIPRVQGECEQKQSDSQSECHFPGLGIELSLHASASLSRARSLADGLSVSVQRRGESTISHMPQAAGSHGFIYPSCAVGSPENESVHEMGFVNTFQPDS